MKINALETKCPVCGGKNTPVEFSAEIGAGGAQVTAEYCCEGKFRRIFRSAKPCQTRYKIVLRNDTAERVIREIHSAGGTGYRARENKEG